MDFETEDRDSTNNIVLSVTKTSTRVETHLTQPFTAARNLTSSFGSAAAPEDWTLNKLGEVLKKSIVELMHIKENQKITQQLLRKYVIPANNRSVERDPRVQTMLELFPIKTIEELERFENQLGQQTHFLHELASTFATYASDGTLGKSVNSVLRNLLTDQVAACFNFEGKQRSNTEKKKGFKMTSLWNLLKLALEKSGAKFSPALSDLTLKSKTSDWLKDAPKRRDWRSKSRPRSDEGREGRNTYSNSPEGAGLSNIGSEERRAITGWNPPRPRSDEGREGRSRYSNSPEGTGLSNIGSEKRQARTGWKPPRPRPDEGREGRYRYSNSPEGTGLSNIGSEKRQARTGWKPPRPRPDEGREGRYRYSNSPEDTGLSNIGSEERRAITGWNPPRPRSDEGREGRNTCSNSPESAGLSKNRPLQKRDRGDRETELAFFEEMLRSSQISSSSVRSSDTKRDEFPLRSAEIPIEKRCSSSVNTQKGAVGATKDISPSRATESPSDMINTNQSKENHSQKSSHEGRKASQEGSLKTSTELCAQSKCLAERIEESDGKISKSVVEAPSPEKISMNRSTEISDSAIKSPSGTLNPFLRAESTRISADGLLLRGKGLQQRGSTRRGKGKKK
ncbi:Hypothetical predicted protein [Cloeon dipterum]|uniref:DUF4806 domain-containing protein n=1 Tax=Cloeon dipterum TaxID=197152 RepID=A0A8S1DYL7_9INSE|nr:Hypothetical predicted protein [Cloeon dipterum]